MATDVTTAGADDVADVPAVEAPPPQPVERAAQPHRRRFLFVYGVLGAVLCVAIAGIVVFAGRSIDPAPAWSTWQPHGGGLGAAQEIAQHVSAAYRLPGGRQLVDVLAKAPSVSPGSSANIPIHYIVVRGAKGQADVPHYDISGSNSVQYALCGLGQSCSIASGKPSVERGTLVRREILELALYTFKYVGGIQNVVAFMPPPAGSQPQYVVYLQRSDVAAQLKQPLAQTLGPKVPLPTTIPAREVHTIDSVTEPRVYKFSLSQAQQGDAILVLAPLPA